MKVTIVYNHPYEKSFNNAILQTTVKALESINCEPTVINLDKENFNPVMTSEDLLAFVKHKQIDEQTKKYTKILEKSDHLILIFPIWWELMPAMMKGFIDKVVFPGSFYEYNSNGLTMNKKMKNIKTITIITTMNTPKIVYRFFFGNAIKKALINGTFKKTGYENSKWISFNMVKQASDNKRRKWLENLEHKIIKRIKNSSL